MWYFWGILRMLPPLLPSFFLKIVLSFSGLWSHSLKPCPTRMVLNVMPSTELHLSIHNTMMNSVFSQILEAYIFLAEFQLDHAHAIVLISHTYLEGWPGQRTHRVFPAPSFQLKECFLSLLPSSEVFCCNCSILQTINVDVGF